jgi:hypothetical protein
MCGFYVYSKKWQYFCNLDNFVNWLFKYTRLQYMSINLIIIYKVRIHIFYNNHQGQVLWQRKAINQWGSRKYIICSVTNVVKEQPESNKPHHIRINAFGQTHFCFSSILNFSILTLKPLHSKTFHLQSRTYVTQQFHWLQIWKFLSKKIIISQFDSQHSHCLHGWGGLRRYTRRASVATKQEIKYRSQFGPRALSICSRSTQSCHPP